MAPPPADGPLLAFDTSTGTARVAVLDLQGHVLAAGERAAERHSTNLLALCDQALRQAGTTVASLRAIACGAGPGSFTGLRVGLSVAKGLALPHETPLVMVPSLEALTRDLMAIAPERRLLVPCLDAGKNEVYACLTGEAGDADADEQRLTPQALAALVAARGLSAETVAIGGNGADRYAEVLATGLGAAAVLHLVPGPSAAAIGRLAMLRLARGESDDLASAVPRYGRLPDITRPRPRATPPAADRPPSKE